MHRALFARTLVIAPIALVAAATMAQDAPPNPQIDYDGFAQLTNSLGEVRQTRLLDRETFLARAAAEGALLLDTRSAAAFEAGHIEGAVNLPFSDFTSTSLREVIGENPDRPIYIYCNNNFSDNAPPVLAKKAPLALNIPTFINLHGYGYTNVWELGGVMETSEVPWVASGG
ncbi:rhodanese-like domain-containing protein [Erythrobacter sp. HKB08]|uniref:rhodanese-like domain-containing protein n=1 Tax=Erythrobacter sp. HKB08 TaxID=2502843 RepID=UPI001008ACC5|nr:rhodanese-like domain-containing protein [Erythrobacter sp. HKB08]